MGKHKLPLKEMSIDDLFNSAERYTYEIPVYQRNYAWEKDEISALIQDVYDAYKKEKSQPYYIGTLVSYNRGDGVFEVIDGQQRLTTISLILDALKEPGKEAYQNDLKYKARRKSDETLHALKHGKTPESEFEDIGITNGYKAACEAIKDKIPNDEKTEFIEFFRSQVHIIHYQVPKDIDLNHYFEIMNTRGEQLEKHEIVKANLMERLEDEDERRVFDLIWEWCSNMSTYIQQNVPEKMRDKVFRFEESFCTIQPEDFGDLLAIYNEDSKSDDTVRRPVSIANIINDERQGGWKSAVQEQEKNDSFQAIIDFPNFLLIVLKVMRSKEEDYSKENFNLDDKELLDEFRTARMNSEQVKQFAFLLFKAKFYLDNYVVHHANEDDRPDNNPWKLQIWVKIKNKGQMRNLCDDRDTEDRLTQLLSMFEVSFTPRQRKNYLFYCEKYLLEQESSIDLQGYTDFVENLADRYYNEVYLDVSKLNAINTPLPHSFDEIMLENGGLRTDDIVRKDRNAFAEIYGDADTGSNGIPLFVFNYLDYKIWELYIEQLRGKHTKENDSERTRFFSELGCNDFGLDVFDGFYFSRTRRSLEHYYPQANATSKDGALNEKQINCLGNYAMIGSAVNSAGSNWSPKTKLDHYLDSSGKISLTSIASLKFMIMMQMCKDNVEAKDSIPWGLDQIRAHQEKMLDILMSC